MISFYVLAAFWLINGVFLTSQSASVCTILIIDEEFETTIPACSISAAAITFAFVVFLLTLTAAFFIHTRAIMYGKKINIARAIPVESVGNVELGTQAKRPGTASPGVASMGGV